jgi:nucleotide-binding universal stress UspA family protein
VGTYSSLEAGTDMVVDELQAEGTEAVEAVAAQADDAGVAAETAVETGIVHRSIVDYVGGEDIDLVVMGTHGRTGVGRILLGSVAENVIRTASVPVMTVRSNEVGGDDGEE